MPLIGDAPNIDIPLWVPGEDSSLLPWQAPFITQANSMLAQMQRIQARMRSNVLFVDKIDAQAGWEVVVQKLAVIGETWAYLQLTLQKKTSPLEVPSDGNFIPHIVGSIKDPRLVPQSLSHLGSTDTGRLAAAHVLNSGEIKLDAINSGRDIAVGDILTLAGAYPLDDWVDSGV